MDVLAALAPDGDSPPRYAVEEALQAADAVDPLRNPPNRAGIAPAGTPTKRIWPDD